jgi:hypothetical protein
MLKRHVTDSTSFLHKAMAKKKKILFEGAQGTFLDIDHGTYPYVTSSNTIAGTSRQALACLRAPSTTYSGYAKHTQPVSERDPFRRNCPVPRGSS